MVLDNTELPSPVLDLTDAPVQEHIVQRSRVFGQVGGSSLRLHAVFLGTTCEQILTNDSAASDASIEAGGGKFCDEVKERPVNHSRSKMAAVSSKFTSSRLHRQQKNHTSNVEIKLFQDINTVK